MKRITHNLRRTETSSILHDSRADSRLFAKMLNLCFDKINELQEEVEKLQEITKPINNDNMKVEITPYYKNL